MLQTTKLLTGKQHYCVDLGTEWRNLNWTHERQAGDLGVWRTQIGVKRPSTYLNWELLVPEAKGEDISKTSLLSVPFFPIIPWILIFPRILRGGFFLSMHLEWSIRPHLSLSTLSSPSKPIYLAAYYVISHQGCSMWLLRLCTSKSATERGHHSHSRYYCFEVKGKKFNYNLTPNLYNLYTWQFSGRWQSSL